MLRSPFASVVVAGVNLSSFGMLIPSPLSKLSIENSEVASMTSFTIRCVIGGDDKRKINVSAFEALIYSAAQASEAEANSSGIPISFAFGWVDNGNVSEYTSYQGFCINYTVSTTGINMIYELTGYAQLAMQTSMPVLNIPELS